MEDFGVIVQIDARQGILIGTQSDFVLCSSDSLNGFKLGDKVRFIPLSINPSPNAPFTRTASRLARWDAPIPTEVRNGQVYVTCRIENLISKRNMRTFFKSTFGNIVQGQWVINGVKGNSLIGRSIKTTFNFNEKIWEIDHVLPLHEHQERRQVTGFAYCMDNSDLIVFAPGWPGDFVFKTSDADRFLGRWIIFTIDSQAEHNGEFRLAATELFSSSAPSENLKEKYYKLFMPCNINPGTEGQCSTSTYETVDYKKSDAFKKYGVPHVKEVFLWLYCKPANMRTIKRVQLIPSANQPYLEDLRMNHLNKDYPIKPRTVQSNNARPHYDAPKAPVCYNRGEHRSSSDSRGWSQSPPRGKPVSEERCVRPERAAKGKASPAPSMTQGSPQRPSSRSFSSTTSLSSVSGGEEPQRSRGSATGWSSPEPPRSLTPPRPLARIGEEAQATKVARKKKVAPITAGVVPAIVEGDSEEVMNLKKQVGRLVLERDFYKVTHDLVEREHESIGFHDFLRTHNVDMAIRFKTAVNRTLPQ